MASILKVKDANGNIVEIPAIRGPRGPQGPAGPGSGDMKASVYDPTGKAQDVFKYVDDKVGSIPTPDVSAQISKHNSDTSAHSDIRKAVSDHAGSKNNPHGVTAALVGAPTVAEMNAAIAAIPTPDVSGQINTHNTSASAHNDIRSAISALPTSGYVASAAAPSNTKILWVDTGNGGITKYYNGSAWVATKAAWG